MFIKKLTVQGFKSYRDQVIVDPFSPGVNVVVGRNGSGKSNFFSAIRFVLGDAYTSLSREARQALLHEGVTTASTFSAYVEVVFDNTDKRFPTGKDDVVLRRTVGAKKDEYSLDRKSTGKGEVMSLLESAGFNKSNPYYIVPQGRITHLTNQKDPERLELLKEVAGTRVYEDRRTESIKNISEAETKRAKVDDLLQVIEERLNELEEEKKELKEFSTRDRERRCLEYSIYQRELSDVTAKLNEIEDERADVTNTANEARDAFLARQREIVQVESRLNDNKQQVDLLDVEKNQLVSDRQEAIKAKTQLECLVRDESDASTTSASTRAALEQQIKELQSSINSKETELHSDVGPEATQVSAQVHDMQTRLNDAIVRSELLYAKQVRSSQFRNQHERDAYLRRDITNLENRIGAKEERLEETRGLVKSCKSSLEQLTTQLREATISLDGRKDALRELSSESSAFAAEKTKLIERRKELWKEESKLQTMVRHAQTQCSDAETQLARAMDRNTAAGLKAINRIAREHNIIGVFGPLYRLFTVPEVYRQAAEITAGASLFHVVVDTDATATKVLELMKREKAGRVTFMPLNRLKPKPVHFPENDSSVQPILRKLRFEPEHEKAFNQVFGKTLVCESLSSASAAMRRYQLNVITLDGDRVDRKGALTGGFHDARRSRLQAAEQLQRWATELATNSTKLSEANRTRGRLDQEITQLTGRLSMSETRLRQLEESRQPLLVQVTNLREDVAREESRLQKLENALQNVESDLNSSRTQLTSNQTEIQQPMVQVLSEAELDSLTDYTKTIESVKGELAVLTKRQASLESRKRLLEIELRESLQRKHDELKTKLESTYSSSSEPSDETDASEQRGHQSEVETLERSISHHSERLSAIESQSDELSQAIQQLQSDLEKLQSQQADDARGIARQNKGTERYHSKKSLLEQRKEETEGHIRDLGVLPEEAFEKYINYDSDQLVSNLHEVNDALKKFSSVNKKAVEQFSSFATQKEELQERREELDNSADSIQQLLDTLDQRKDEAIERTFSQVARNFQNVFERLVPAGRGRLIMQRKSEHDRGEEDQEEVEDMDEASQGESEGEQDEEDDGDEEEASRKGRKRASTRSRQSKSKKAKKAPRPSKKSAKRDQDSSGISAYTGVSIRVSFNSKQDEGLHIQQLSGGQKSLVALALVFSIQKCDPAPFYLFDEIDANLDADRRTAVAAMIKELSQDAQFIITTFRPELLAHADQFLGVIFDARKVSTVKQISQDDCMTFVEANEKTS